MFGVVFLLFIGSVIFLAALTARFIIKKINKPKWGKRKDNLTIAIAVFYFFLLFADEIITYPEVYRLCEEAKNSYKVHAVHPLGLDFYTPDGKYRDIYQPRKGAIFWDIAGAQSQEEANQISKKFSALYEYKYVKGKGFSRRIYGLRRISLGVVYIVDSTDNNKILAEYKQVFTTLGWLRESVTRNELIHCAPDTPIRDLFPFINSKGN